METIEAFVTVTKPQNTRRIVDGERHTKKKTFMGHARMMCMAASRPPPQYSAIDWQHRIFFFGRYPLSFGSAKRITLLITMRVYPEFVLTVAIDYARGLVTLPFSTQFTCVAQVSHLFIPHSYPFSFTISFTFFLGATRPSFGLH